MISLHLRFLIVFFLIIGSILGSAFFIYEKYIKRELDRQGFEVVHLMATTEAQRLEKKIQRYQEVAKSISVTQLVDLDLLKQESIERASLKEKTGREPLFKITSLNESIYIITFDVYDRIVSLEVLSHNFWQDISQEKNYSYLVTQDLEVLSSKIKTSNSSQSQPHSRSSSNSNSSSRSSSSSNLTSPTQSHSFNKQKEDEQDPIKKILIEHLKKNSNQNTVFKSSTGQNSFFLGSIPLLEYSLNFVVSWNESKIKAQWRLVFLYIQNLFYMVLGFLMLLTLLLLRQILQPIKTLVQATDLIGQGLFDVHFFKKPRNELGLLMQAFEKMSLKISDLIKKTQEQVRLESEIQTAQLVQKQFYPKESYSYSNLEIKGFIHPVTECGGDIWMTWKTHNWVYVVLGDVTGHGVSAALLTSSIFSVLHTVQEQEILNITTIAKLLNSAIKKVGQSNSTATGIILQIDTKTGELRWIHCEHESFVLKRVSKKSQTWKDLSFVSSPQNLAWGKASEKTIYSIGQDLLDPGDCIVLYTDGVFDLNMNHEKKINDRLFGNLICKGFETLNQELNLLYKTQLDDVTVVWIDVSPEALWIQSVPQSQNLSETNKNPA
jgi:serine phosphatase RsbU (regulator of sigma subunit)